MNDWMLEKVWLWKLIKDKQKGSIRASSAGLTRGYGHELLKLIPDVWGLSAISSRRPTRLKNWQNCKIAILLDKANISLWDVQSCYIFCSNWREKRYMLLQFRVKSFGESLKRLAVPWQIRIRKGAKFAQLYKL